MSHVPRGARACTLILAVLCWPAGHLYAQTGALLPEERHFQWPVADAMGPRISTALLRTDLLATQGPERPPFQLPEGAAREVVAAVSIGAVFPLVTLATWDGGGVQLVVDGRVFGRFRIERPERDDMGQDWWVGGALEGARDRWSGRVGIMHRSSHIGDEFAEGTGARRIEFGGEQLDLMASYDLPAVARVYGGGSWIFRSYLGWDNRLRELGVRDRAVLQLGADREWRPWTDPRLAVHAGLDIHAADRTNWRPGYAVAAGVGVRTQRALRLTLRGYEGLSMMGEFFLTRERYAAFELSVEF